MNGAAGERRDHFARAAESFAALRPLGAQERHAALEALAASDPALADEVRSLLQHDTADASFLGRPVVMAPEGLLVGRYRIESVIGEGGMGTVFLAQQVEPVQRAVALKLIKLGMDTRAIVRRFEAERQVLARMEHPGIARILDAGVAPDGRPYFVMELVRGEPITQWCEAQRLDTPARIRLFLQVCAAVQHAHQKGVIHRDLKPSNLLVTQLDGMPAPKVIDFGIAKALDQDGPAVTEVAGAGPVAGTPEYMSPEQAGLIDADGVDIRSDVYSLGVVLYELLTGTTPARARTRSGTTRRPGSIRPRLRGDLDAIILKAVALEPSRRYATVAALAEDLERHLRHEPVQARPAGAAYLTAQFARRHTLALGAAAVVLLALLTGLGMALWGLQRARAELFASTVERGRLAGVVGDLVEARETLWDCYLQQPESPHAAWALRELYFRYPSIWTLRGAQMHSAEVQVLDANAIMLAGPGRAPIKIDVETGTEVMCCSPGPEDGLKHRPHGMDISPDRSLVAVGDSDGHVRLWSLVDGRYMGTMARHTKGTASVTFLADSRTLVTGGMDGRFLRVAVDHPEAAQLLWKIDGWVRSLVSHHSTGQMAAGMADGTILLWRSVDQPPVQLEHHTSRVLSLAFDAAGEHLASGSTDRTAVVWSTRDGTSVTHLLSNNGTVRDLAYAADGTLYILGWWHLDRLRPGQEALEQVIAEGGWRIAMPRDDEVIVSTGQAGVLRRWHTDARALYTPLPADPEWRLRALTGGEGPLLLAKGRSLMARSLAGQTQWEHTFDAAISAVGASADGSCVAVGTADQALWVRRVTSRAGTAGASPAARGEWRCVARDFEPGTQDVVAVDLTGKHVAYRTAADGVAMVSLADAGDPAVRVVLPASLDEQVVIQFTRDGAQLAAAQRRGSLRLYNLQTGETVQHACGQTAFAIDSTPDGTILLGGWTGPILQVHPQRGLEATLRGHTAVVGTLAVHPRDPQLVLTGSMDGTVRLWHLGMQREVQSLTPLDGLPIRLVAFDATGDNVVVAGADGRAVRWEFRAADRFIRDNAPGVQAAVASAPRK